jgi:hypothetical protein
VASAGTSFATRLALTLLVASAGAFAGVNYGRLALPKGSNLAPMYGVAGALTAVLSLRVLALLRSMWKDFFGPPPEPPSESESVSRHLPGDEDDP